MEGVASINALRAMLLGSELLRRAFQLGSQRIGWYISIESTEFILKEKPNKRWEVFRSPKEIGRINLSLSQVFAWL